MMPCQICEYNFDFKQSKVSESCSHQYCHINNPQIIITQLHLLYQSHLVFAIIELYVKKQNQMAVCSKLGKIVKLFEAKVPAFFQSLQLKVNLFTSH